MLQIPAFESARVLVVGDVMLDRYWYGDTGRISPEAPVPVVRIGDEEQRLGGAGNVALNLARIGVRTTLLGVVGKDEAATTVEELLVGAGVQTHFVTSATHPTIDKLRVLSRNQQLIRLDAEQSFADDQAFDTSALLEKFEMLLDQTDAVVCSDYGKGTLCDVQTLIKRAVTASVPVLVDPKGGDWQRYANATLITPNRSEFETVAGVSRDEQALETTAKTLRDKLSLEALLVTRSEEGMSLFSEAGHLHLPTHAQEVFDVTGAGDTVIALLAGGLAAGQSMGQAARLANLAASIVVAKLGTATVTPAELHRAVRSRHSEPRGISQVEQLTALIAEAQGHGEKVVMTNGCFDLLHPGHIEYLEAARALGDWLVVAVNEDASVARLKGPTRPINPVDHRMRVLCGLAAVDWVVPFADDTPARLIGQLQPDILVKGGDYKVADIAGADDVLAGGGEVRVLDFVDGYSTTTMVERMRATAKQSESPTDG